MLTPGTLVLPTDLGPPVKSFDLAGDWRRRNRQYAVDIPYWLSHLAFFAGPYDDRSGLPNSGKYFHKYQDGWRNPQVYLRLDAKRLSICPANAIVEPISVQWELVSTLTLAAGTRSRLAILTPGRAPKVGTMVVETTDRRSAVLTGISARAVAEAAVELGLLEE